MEEKIYEFTEAQNALLGKLASRMKFVAIFLLIAGGLTGIVGIATLPGGVGSIILAAIYIVIGIWTLKAAGAFNEIVTTEKKDISHLMDALTELKKLYTLQYIAIIIGIVIIGIVFLAGIGAELSV